MDPDLSVGEADLDLSTDLGKEDLGLGLETAKTILQEGGPDPLVRAPGAGKKILFFSSIIFLKLPFDHTFLI